jgi:hypothetical protein
VEEVLDKNVSSLIQMILPRWELLRDNARLVAPSAAFGPKQT